MGSVERVLVLGIVVVIVAILGIAVWGATGDDAGPLANAATDGGAAVADGPASPALKNARKNKNAGPAAVDEIKRWREATREQRDELKQDKQGKQPTPPTVKPTLKNQAPTKAPLKPVVTPVQQPKPRPVQPKPKPEPVESAGPTVHTVAAGDSLWKITYKYFGDSDIQENLDAILAANPTLDPDEFLQIGQRIVIPVEESKKAPAKTAATKPAVSGEFDLYEVQEGDTLTAIASRMLGSSNRFTEIYELNRDRMTAPDVLHVGMTLRLPKR